MTDQKAENILNLALSTPEEDRAQTDELNVGFDAAARTWEIIVKFNGDLRGALEVQFPSVKFRELSGGFGILTVPETQVEAVIGLPEIEYAEKPKRLYFAVNRARAVSCFLPVQSSGESGSESACQSGASTIEQIDREAGERGAENLSGCGVLVGIVDSGIDYFHEDFRNSDGSTRILYLYDQVLDRVFTKAEIDQALETGSRDQARTLGLVPSVDGSGHGTAVAGIAAGNGRESDGLYRGAAYESDLLVVRLGVPDPEGFPRTTQVMTGLDFVVQKAIELGRPVAVNLSFGNAYGSHDGNGLFERFIDLLAEKGRSVFVIGTGNEGDMAGHVRGQLSAGLNGETRGGTGTVTRTGAGEMATRPGEQVIELSVAPYETGFGVQLWKNYEDVFEIYLRNPAGTITEQISSRLGPHEIDMGGAKVLLYYGEPSPFNQAQEIYFDFLPTGYPSHGQSPGAYIESGIWEFILRPVEIVDGRFDFWLPSAGALNRATRFLRPEPETTLTIPSTALRPISVGAYDDSTMTYAAFSGRGDTRAYGIQKPDLVAPGVGIVTTQRDGGYAPVTGTSFAAPLVTGAAALLMEWGIVRGNDPYLYGDKVKAYLRKGARKLPGETEVPNPRVGYGALCVAESLTES